MDAGRIQRSKNLNQVVSDKQMRASGPMLRVAVVALQILHPLLAWDLMPVSKPGNKRVVQHDELRAPSA